jgi:hypothetical protein
MRRACRVLGDRVDGDSMSHCLSVRERGGEGGEGGQGLIRLS